MTKSVVPPGTEQVARTGTGRECRVAVPRERNLLRTPRRGRCGFFTVQS